VFDTLLEDLVTGDERAPVLDFLGKYQAREYRLELDVMEVQLRRFEEMVEEVRW